MKNNTLYRKNIISIRDLTPEDVSLIIEYAHALRQSPRGHTLNQYILGSCFFEASTRTRLSFEAAAARAGMQVIGFADDKNTSLGKKGESLSDSLKVIGQYVDCLVMRHPREGSARLAAEVCDIPVINGGDGANQHPTQTLLDLFTIENCQGQLNELHIAFTGDLKYGRAVHSLVEACAWYNMRFYFVAPDALTLPESTCHYLRDQGVKFSFHENLSEIIDRVDILYATRIQRERFDEAKYRSLQRNFVITPELLKMAKRTMRILHPLPRVDEIDPAVDDTPHAYYFEQAKNGLYVREALMRLILSEEIV